MVFFKMEPGQVTPLCKPSNAFQACFHRSTKPCATWLSCLPTFISSLLALYVQVMVTHPVYSHFRAFAHGLPPSYLEHSPHPHSGLYMEGSFSLLRTLLKYYLKEACLTFQSEVTRVILQSLSICHALKKVFHSTYHYLR